MHHPGHEQETNLLLFEFGAWGHIPNYLKLLFEYWHHHVPGMRLHAVLGPTLIQNHPAVFSDIDPSKQDRIRWTAISQEEEKIVRRYDLINKTQNGADMSHASNKYMFMWSLIQRHVVSLRPRHVTFLTLDEILLPLTAGLRLGTEMSGILFRPFFQYPGAWANSVPALAHMSTLPQRLFVNRLLNHPELKVTFLIDEFVSRKLSHSVKSDITYLPDPVKIPASRPDRAAIDDLRKRLGIPDRSISFLFFGDITERKGLWNTLKAIASLDEKDSSRICLLIVGKAGEVTERRLTEWVRELKNNNHATVIRRGEYISDLEMYDWFSACDVVLAPYHFHVGMSGIQLLAAAHQRPIISQEFGLMGDLTKEHKLGMTCDAENPSSIANSIRSWVRESNNPIWDPMKTLEFAKSHSSEEFAKTIVNKLEPLIRSAS